VADALTLRQLNRATLARQMLLARERATTVRAIEHLIGLQAQLARPPFVGLWSRVQDFDRADLVRLMTERAVVRATAMRATLHVMTAADYLKLRGCLQPALDRAMQGVLGDRAARLNLRQLDEVARRFFETPHTFDSAREHLRARFRGGDERAMAYAARLRLPLVQVPTGATWGFPAQADFIAADRWLGKSPAGARRPDALVRRYLAAYGPATVADAQAWSGLPNLRPVLEAMRPKLRTFRDPEGAELFDLPDAPRPDPDDPAPVRFVPEYDNIISSRADARLVPIRHRSKVFLPGLRVLATVLVDGFVAGTWKIERERAVARLVVEPFTTLPASVRRDVESEGQALLRFAEPDARDWSIDM
jgi:hypothetical protein